MTKKIVAIWAQDEKGVIGKEDRLPCICQQSKQF